MALTLTEGAKLSNDVILQGVIETVVKESRVLDHLPFIEMMGNALTYNRENAMATAAFFDVGDSWSESTPTFTQVTAALKILGGDADVDKYIATTRTNVQDIEAAVLELKAKAVRTSSRTSSSTATPPRTPRASTACTSSVLPASRSTRAPVRRRRRSR